MLVTEVGHGQIPAISRPQEIGRVFYVATSGFRVAGNNGNSGIDPSEPFLTIDYALSQCAQDRNDYIIVMDCYQEDVFPIEIDVQKVHIIGLYQAPDGSWPMMTSIDNPAIFEISAVMGGIEAVEIAGFSLGCGATHGCIELAGANNMTHIHHCTFGQWWVGGGQDGIRLVAGSHFNVIIEDCWFHGSDSPNGKLSRNGVYFDPAVSVGQSTIRNNYFVMLPTSALYLHGNAIHGVIVDHNTIACVNVNGAGIDLGGNALGCLLSDNRANYGDTDMANPPNPFLDNSVAGSNHWMANWLGITPTHPV